MNEKVRINSNKRYVLFALSIHFPAWYAYFGIVGKRLNIKFEYKKPRVTKRKKGV